MAFTNEQLERYSRHIILKEIGVKGQKKLLNAKVLIIGAGGLGAPAALYLAAAGVGTIGIADADVVDLSNLQILIGLNYRVQIEDQAELLTTLGSKEAIDEFDRKLDEYINSWVEENATELATDS